MNLEDLIATLIDFSEENWVAFIFRAEEKGYNEKDVEIALDKLKQSKIYI